MIFDPGHGGRDPGAVSPSGLQEKDLLLDVAKRTAKLEPGFEGRVRFVFTRLTDIDLAPQEQPFTVNADFRARSDLANSICRPDSHEDRIYIALHMNADASRTGRGLSTWSFPGSQAGAGLARLVQGRLRNQLRPWVGSYGAGLFTANFHVLRETSMPAALVEAGFIGTPAEAEELAKPTVRQHIADGLVLAVADWFGERYIFLSDCDQEYESFDWSTPSRATPDELEAAFEGTAMAGLGAVFLQAESESRVHALGLAALAAWESAWGSSRIARDKQNLFHFGATDDDAYGNARSFTTKGEGVRFVASRIRRDYLDPTGQFYHGSNLRGMNVCYAADQNWRHGIAQLWEGMRPFAQRFGSEPSVSLLPPAPVLTPASAPEVAQTPVQRIFQAPEPAIHPAVDSPLSATCAEIEPAAASAPSLRSTSDRLELVLQQLQRQQQLLAELISQINQANFKE